MGESFDQIKYQILFNLSNGLDYSPKGSIDVPVRDFVSLINALPDYVTTSSCSGRISVSYSLGESKGVNWTLVKHGFVTLTELLESINVDKIVHENVMDALFTLKCEPFIMHICCRDLDHAKLLHHIAMECGYRESGITVGNRRVMLAIRTTSFHLELPIARNGKFLFDCSITDAEINQVQSSYLQVLINEANHRLKQNLQRTDRLLQAIKDHFQYPSLKVCSSSSLSQSNRSDFYELFGKISNWWKRWGHMIIPIRESNDFVVVGGQGIEDNERTQQKSGRNLVNFSYSDYLLLQKKTSKYAMSDFLTKTNPYREIGNVVHGRGSIVTFSLSNLGNAMKHTFLLVSGGRQSPLRALDPLQIYYYHPVEHRYVSFQTCGKIIDISDSSIPSPRWGHTFVKLTENKFFLCSGRDEKDIFDDCYMLELTLQSDNSSSIVITVKWTPLLFSIYGKKTTSGIDIKRIFKRYFHASANMLAREESEYSAKYGCNQLLIHGGMMSLYDPTEISSEGYLINFHLKVIRPIIIAIPSSQLGDGGCVPLGRFGHVILPLPGKTMMVIGGMSLLNEEAISVDAAISPVSMNSYNPSYLFDLSSVDLLNFGSAPLFLKGKSVLIDPSDQAQHHLPCEQCRAHHDAFFDFTRNMIHVVGGGAMSLAFGDHFCTSVILSVLKNQHCEDQVPSASIKMVADNLLLSNIQASGNSAIADEKKQSSSVPYILLDSKNVKRLKTWLESKNLIEKSVKIAKTSFDSLSKLKQSAKNVNSNISIISLNPDTSSQEPSELDNDDVLRSIMAIPITQDLYLNILSSSFQSNCFCEEIHNLVDSNVIFVTSRVEDVQNMKADNRKDISSINGNQTYVSPEGFLNTIESLAKSKGGVHSAHIKPYKKRPPFISKETKANNFLKKFMLDEGISDESALEIPSKYELVGDILMIPDKAFNSPCWKDAIAKDSTKFWTTLSSFFKVNRVARKAFIHSGPMRKSQVQLLFTPSNDRCEKKKVCICGEDHSSSSGWVTVIENRIQFSFDITKVMFCSGNNTERMRMGALRIPNEVVVDFYCGIGYYTVPLLFYSQLKFLYALEWNPDSIYALKHNLAKANILQDRFQILVGDNQLTSEALVDVADRILLGLLPSSVPGWKLAARALKATGGTIHVHENVHERDIQEWIENMKIKFHDLLEAEGKCMQLEVRHIEIVKSYAPRVYHYVIDLECRPVLRA